MPVLWHDGLNSDGTCLLLLAIGIKHNYPYFIYLVDDFHRRRIAFEGTEQQKKQSENAATGKIDAGRSLYPPKQWIKENIHTMQVEISNIAINADEMFKYYKSSSLQISQTDNNTRLGACSVPATGGILLESSIPTFGKRICPNFEFKTIFKINGSLELACLYFEAVVGFIYNIVQTKPNHRGSTICPFQVYL